MTDGLQTTNVTDADLQSALSAGSQSFETMNPISRCTAAHNRIEPLYLGRRPVLPCPRERSVRP